MSDVERDPYGNRLDDLVPVIVVDLRAAMDEQPKRAHGLTGGGNHALSTYMEPRPEHMQGRAVPIYTPWPSKVRRP